MMTKNSKPSKAESERSELGRAREALTRYLARRDHSARELSVKLARRFEPDVIEQALEWALEKKLLVAEKDLARRVDASLGRQLKSHRQIRATLQKRGLPATAEDREAELEKIRRLMEKRFQFVGKMSYEDRVKVYRYLKYRGFNDSLIKQVLNEKQNSPEF